MIFNASFFQAISKLPILWHPDLPSTSNLTPHAACGSFWVQCWELMAVLPGEVLTQAISAGVEVNDVEKCLGDLGDSDIKWWEQSGRNLPNWLVLETGEVSSDSARCFKWWIHVPGVVDQTDLSTIESKDVGMLKHCSISLGQWTFLDMLHFSVQFGHNYIIPHHYVPKIFKPRRLTQVKDSKSWRYAGTMDHQVLAFIAVVTVYLSTIRQN